MMKGKMSPVARLKVHRVGGSLMVSLPKIWWERNRIARGRVVEAYFGEGDELIIKPEEGDESE